jgi:uncharacterized protein (UPF0332 family)
MTGDWVAPEDRAREELRAARSLLDSGFPSQALSRAYSAGLQVAVATLAGLGETPATEAGVISAFGRRIVSAGAVDHEHGRTLRQLFEDRNDVEAGLLSAPDYEARRAIESAERLVEAGAQWVAQRQR